MKKRYRNTAFLVELMVNILVFCISCAILVALFGQAAIYTRESRRQSAASGEIQNIVETIKVKGLENYPLDSETNKITLHYDEDWRRTDDMEAVSYQIVLYIDQKTTDAGTLVQIEASAYEYTIPISSYGPVIYTLSTAIYQPNEGGAAA